MTSIARDSTNPLQGLYDFVRGHLMIINAVIMSSTFIVGALDFVVPRATALPRIIYSCTAGLALLMLASALAPGVVARLVEVVGLVVKRDPGAPLWRRPLWQLLFAYLVLVSTLGFASVAKAHAGGLLASQVPALRTLQAELLGIDAKLASLSSGVDLANGKLDVLIGERDDAQKQLVSLGYEPSDVGLGRAIRNDDTRAVKLFAKVGTTIRSHEPMQQLVFGNGSSYGVPSLRWNQTLVDAIPAGTFVDTACASASSRLAWGELMPHPRLPRLAFFKSQCGVQDAWQDLKARLEAAQFKGTREQDARELLRLMEQL